MNRRQVWEYLEALPFLVLLAFCAAMAALVLFKECT